MRKAFNEGRRAGAAPGSTMTNPYANPRLQQLWEDGRAQQRAGTLTTPIPPLEPGERRAERVQHNPPGSKRAKQPPPRRPGGGGGGYRGNSGGGRSFGGGSGGFGGSGGRPRPR
jgi:hypothetical protein